MTTRLVVGPFNRVEGDLEVTVDVADGRVAAAWVSSPLFRGFEHILLGRDPGDALALVPRICGICSVSQSAAAAAVLRDALGLELPRNGALATNLILATENLADHFTHFYLFFMPDFAREAYRGRPWFDAARARFKAVEGPAAAQALPVRASFLKLLGILAGKWPHSMTLQPGGVARAVTAAEKIRLYAMLREFRGWLERHLFGDALEAVAALDSVAALDAWRAARAPQASDLCLLLQIADDLGLSRLGCGSDRFLSYGSYALDGAPLFARGLWRCGDAAATPFDHREVVEEAASAWMADARARHPWEGDTRVDGERDSAYTWCKAPRLGGAVFECGALARQAVAGQPLLRELVAGTGGNVAARVIARLLELARVVPAMEAWVRAIAPGEPFCVTGALPDTAAAVGLVEAARGGLGHWLVIRQGRIANYQIIAPTTWNFSPRDAAGVPGVLEQALVGAPVGEGETVPLAVQHIVRSFDPCMVCTVH